MTPIFTHALVTFFYEDNQGNIGTEELTSRVTFAAVPASPGETTQYAASWVAPMDNFIKKLGRQRAQRRLGQASYVNEVLVTSDRYDDFWTTIFADAVGNGPCRWTITDISFFRSATEPTATV